MASLELQWHLADWLYLKKGVLDANVYVGPLSSGQWLHGHHFGESHRFGSPNQLVSDKLG